MKHHFFHAEVGFAVVVLKLDQQEVHVTTFLFAYLCLLLAKKKKIVLHLLRLVRFDFDNLVPPAPFRARICCCLAAVAQ